MGIEIALVTGRMSVGADRGEGVLVSLHQSVLCGNLYSARKSVHPCRIYDARSHA